MSLTDRSRRDEFVERFRAALLERRVLSGVRRLLVAGSGGADSTALALLFHDACLDRGLSIHLGHVNHGIRGEESELDESFVGSLAARLGFPFVSERVSVPELMEGKGLSTEVAARTLRYEVFRRWADALSLDAIALAHHRDDQHETIIWRLARGAGLAGLRGIPRERLLEDTSRPVRLLRPLLDWSRSDLLTYLRLCGQEFREDSTNRLLDQPRNRIRHEVLPLLETAVHPGVRSSLDRLSELASQVTDDLRELARRCREEALVSEEGSPGTVELDSRAVARWPPSVRRELLVIVLSSLGDPSPPSEEAFSRFDSLVREAEATPPGSPPPARSEDLGEGLTAELRYGRIAVYRRDRGERRAGPAEATLLVGGPPVAWRGWIVGAERCEWPGTASGPLEEWVDGDRIESELALRSRREGDVFQPLGSGGRKKLKEFFRERRVPPRLRDSRPLVTSGGEIVWVVGERLAHPFRVRPETRNTVRLYARRKE